MRKIKIVALPDPVKFHQPFVNNFPLPNKKIFNKFALTKNKKDEPPFS